jgi:hypothetical protein
LPFAGEATLARCAVLSHWGRVQHRAARSKRRIWLTDAQGTNFAGSANMADSDEQVSGASEPSNASAKRRSGVFKLLLEEHGEVFASAKRLGMRADAPQRREFEGERLSRAPGAVVEVCAALRAVVQTELAQESNPPESDLADAMAALDALNPGSPEWGPTFLQLSELVEARVNEDEFAPAFDDSRRLSAAG